MVMFSFVWMKCSKIEEVSIKDEYGETRVQAWGWAIYLNWLEWLFEDRGGIDKTWIQRDKSSSLGMPKAPQVNI